MDFLFWFLEIAVRPFFYLVFVLLVLRFVLKPLINYFAVHKMIQEQKQLHKEFLDHKKKIKEERIKDREEREKRLLNA